jgi:hypothetical protein
MSDLQSSFFRAAAVISSCRWSAIFLLTGRVPVIRVAGS